MTTFQLNIAVNIGVTDELKQLLTSIFTTSCYAPTPVDANELVPPTPIAANKLVPPTIMYLTEETQPTAAEEEPAPAATPAEKIYTEVDVREAMDRTRRRIEGEDYKTNTDGERYIKWHRKLTGWFKNTAAIYGSDKPSTLPDSDSRRKFIEDCDRVHTNEDDLTMPIPF